MLNIFFLYLNESVMPSINNNLESNLVKTPSSQDLCDGFVQTFNNIFSFDNNDIEVTGTVDKPWFKAKDILKILGYSDQSSTIKNIIHKNIPNKYKKERGGLFEVDHPLSSNVVNNNKDKEIFISEAGLYRLVMRSNKPNAEPFQDFVQDVLIPNIRKQIVKNVNNENNSLRNDIRIVVKKLESMEKSHEETNIKLDDINNKLGKALPDRNVDPVDKELKHQYILFKNKLIDNEYMFLRGQDKYIRNKINFYKNNFDIIIEPRKNPNPIDLANRLKEKISLINKSNYSYVVGNFKCSGEYKILSNTEKCKTILNLKKENSKILYRINKITLLNYSEKMFLKLINELDNEKYNV